MTIKYQLELSFFLKRFLYYTYNEDFVEES